jgi:hypothetical protein
MHLRFRFFSMVLDLQTGVTPGVVRSVQNRSDSAKAALPLGEISLFSCSITYPSSSFLCNSALYVLYSIEFRRLKNGNKLWKVFKRHVVFASTEILGIVQSQYTEFTSDLKRLLKNR